MNVPVDRYRELGSRSTTRHDETVLPRYDCFKRRSRIGLGAAATASSEPSDRTSPPRRARREAACHLRRGPTSLAPTWQTSRAVSALGEPLGEGGLRRLVRHVCRCTWRLREPGLRRGADRPLELRRDVRVRVPAAEAGPGIGIRELKFVP
jgi:hypothetical protein